MSDKINEVNGVIEIRRLLKMSRKRILCIEDEADMLEMVRFRLEHEGYEVISAINGKEGLDKAYKDNPDLILLDLMLPEKGAGTRKVPVVIFAHGNAERIDFWPQELKPFTRLGVGLQPPRH